MIIFLIIFLLVVGSVVYYYHAMTEKENESEKNNFIYQYTTIEAKINSFVKISGLLRNNGSIEDYVSSNEKGYYVKSYNVIREIDGFAEIMSETSEFYLIDIDKNVCFSRNGSKNATELLEELGLNEQVLGELIRETGNSEIGYVISGADMMFVVDTYKYPKQKKLICMMACPLQNDFLTTASKSSFLLANEQNCESIGNARVAAAIKEAGNQHSIQVVETVNMRTYIYPSECIDGLVYVQRYGTGFFVWKLILLFGFAVICILCCIGGKKLIDILSFKTYSPIDSVLQIFEEGTDIDELSSSVKKIIRENEVLVSKMTVNMQILKKHYLQEVLHGESHSGYSDFFEGHTVELPTGSCRAVYLECDVKNKKVQGAFLFEQVLERMLMNTIGGEFVQIEKNKYVLIVPEEGQKDLTGNLLRVIEVSEKTYGVSVIAVIGKKVESVAEINESYKSVLEMLECRYSFEEQSVACYDNMSFERKELYYPIEIENELTDSVLCCNKERTKQVLEMLLNENFVNRSLDMQNISEFKFAVVSTIKKIIRKMGETDERVFGEGSVVYLEISAAKTGQELRNNVINLFEHLNEYVAQRSNNQQNHQVKKITDYIYSNFDKDISLEMASEYMYISQGHINKIMRKELNKSFKEFLDEVRIAEAKKLLTETLMSINEVGEKTGYLNANSFIRFFKKHTNVSPGEYRRKYSGIAEE